MNPNYPINNYMVPPTYFYSNGYVCCYPPVYCLRYPDPSAPVIMEDVPENESLDENQNLETVSKSSELPISAVKKDYVLDENILRPVFERLSTQELLQTLLVCRQWHAVSRENLIEINHLKLISPSRFDSLLWPCVHLPSKEPCSRKKYFCTTLKPYEEDYEELSYFDQIELITEKLKDNQITSLDIYGCPRLASALSFLLSKLGENLQCLSLNKVGCLIAYSFKVWQKINVHLPVLKKLALVQIGVIPEDMPILGQLDEFHFATSKNRFDPNVLIVLLLQLGDNLRKLSLNLQFPIECLVQLYQKKPSVVANITHLELYVKSKVFAFKFVCSHFASLTHLVLILGESRPLYLDIIHNLTKLSRLRYLRLIEDSKNPSIRLISTLKAKSKGLPILKSIRVLHLEVSLKDYTEVSCLEPIFPNIEEIIFKYLNTDSYCICPDTNEFLSLTECENCCDKLKEMLYGKFGSIRKVYGIEPDSYYEEKYGKVNWRKCQYEWL